MPGPNPAQMSASSICQWEKRPTKHAAPLPVMHTFVQGLGPCVRLGSARAFTCSGWRTVLVGQVRPGKPRDRKESAFRVLEAPCSANKFTATLQAVAAPEVVRLRDIQVGDEIRVDIKSLQSEEHREFHFPDCYARTMVTSETSRGRSSLNVDNEDNW